MKLAYIFSVVVCLVDVFLVLVVFALVVEEVFLVYVCAVVVVLGFLEATLTLALALLLVVDVVVAFLLVVAVVVAATRHPIATSAS